MEGTTLSANKVYIVTAYAHDIITKGERVACDPDVGVWDGAKEVDHPTLGKCRVGHFIAGIATNYLFPIDAIRVATPEERAEWMRPTFCSTFADPFKLQEEDFAQ